MPGGGRRGMTVNDQHKTLDKLVCLKGKLLNIRKGRTVQAAGTEWQLNVEHGGRKVIENEGGDPWESEEGPRGAARGQR